jgi:hypothetical protein
VKKRLSLFILAVLFIILVPVSIFAKDPKQDNVESNEQSIVKLTGAIENIKPN